MELDEARAILLKNCMEHPECADTEQAARGLVMDSIPKRQAEKNILITLYHEGFVDDLRQSEEVQLLCSRYRMILINEYGYSEAIAVWCIDTWCLVKSGLDGRKISGSENDGSQGEEYSSYELLAVKSEYERLLEEINNLKGVIIALTTERDDLKYHVCRELAAEYNSRIGEIELQVLNAKLRVLELKKLSRYFKHGLTGRSVHPRKRRVSRQRKNIKNSRRT